MNRPKTSTPSSLSRRDFLSMATQVALWLSSALGLIGLWRFLAYQPPSPVPHEFDLGPQDNYPPGSITPIPQANAVVIHSDQDYRAISLVCPHLGCIVEARDDGYTCPCHGSRFDKNGAVLRGPSTHDLRSLHLEVGSTNHLILFGN
jgi:Rieske Fe-S protein